MANVYISKDEEKAISVAIDVMQKYLSDSFDDYEVDDALDELIDLKEKIRKKSVKKYGLFS